MTLHDAVQVRSVENIGNMLNSMWVLKARLKLKLGGFDVSKY